MLGVGLTVGNQVGDVVGAVVGAAQKSALTTNPVTEDRSGSLPLLSV